MATLTVPEGATDILDHDTAASQALVSTSGATYLDAFAGVTLVPPVDGTYLIIFEAQVEGTNNGTETQIAIGLNSTSAAETGSERISEGNTFTSLVCTHVAALVTTDDISGIFRNNSGAGTSNVTDRRMTMVRVG